MLAREAAFIRANLRLAPVPLLPEIRLYTAHSGSRISRLPATPYWAYPWAGGLALARHLAERPETVAGRRVLDLGAGSGLVGIAAARAGAAKVSACEVDRHALAAIGLNASANSVAITPLTLDISGDPPDVDVVLAGDVFYAPDVAASMIAFLGRCRQARRRVLVGDPGRVDLPVGRIEAIAEYPVRDFGLGESQAGIGRVFAFDPG